MLADFKSLTSEAHVVLDEGWTKDQAFIQAMIRYEIDAALFSMEDARRHLVAVDPQALYALSLFGEARGLTASPPPAARPTRRGNPPMPAAAHQGVRRSTTRPRAPKPTSSIRPSLLPQWAWLLPPVFHTTLERLELSGFKSFPDRADVRSTPA